jgi:polar amino acid transport system substrate-binding protein
MKANCVFVLHEWEGIIKGLLAKDYDAVMASLLITDGARSASRSRSRITESRSRSSPARTSTRLGVTPAALAGKRIGTTDRSEHVAFLEARYPESELKTYAKFEDAHLDLVSERIDLVLGDRLALNRFIKAKEGAVCCRLVGDAPHDLAFYSPGVAIGLRKDDKELKEAFNRAIDAVKADGTYDRIRAKYLPFDVK